MEAAAQLIEERDNQEVDKGAAQETLAKLANISSSTGQEAVEPTHSAEHKEGEVQAEDPSNAPPRPLCDNWPSREGTVGSGKARTGTPDDLNAELVERMLLDTEITREDATLYHPCQNGVAERRIRALATAVRGFQGQLILRADLTRAYGVDYYQTSSSAIIGVHVDNLFLLCDDDDPPPLLPVSSSDEGLGDFYTAGASWRSCLQRLGPLSAAEAEYPDFRTHYDRAGGPVQCDHKRRTRA
jgi:hypothetical protein